MSNPVEDLAPLSWWRRALSDRDSDLWEQLRLLYADQAEAWCIRLLQGLEAFTHAYAEDGEDRPVLLSRCPGQMNIAGMHIDYGGMPSLHMAVRGHDTITIAAAGEDGVARFRSLYQAEEGGRRVFDPVQFRLSDLAADPPVESRQDLLRLAGHICAQRERESGTAFDDSWSILPQGGLVYLDSWLRLHGQAPKGVDALVVSNVSPSGGMSSSSALVISTAWAYLGLHGVTPGKDMSWEDAIDGVWTSEWIRGTRGGTADHGGMVLSKAGQLVSVGVFPAQDCGSAPLPSEYVAVILDSGVLRVYDEAGKEETVLAYPLGTWLLRDVLLPSKVGTPGWTQLVGDFRQRIELIRDITPENLGVTTAQLCELLASIPEETSLQQMQAMARSTGVEAEFDAMHESEIGDKFPSISPEYPIKLRRRFTFGLAEQDRVAAMIDFLADGDVATAFELVRISHAGDYDEEVTVEELAEVGARADTDPRGRLAFVAGGYGRMTDAYDRVVTTLNRFLLSHGADAGAVQRLGAGWGGNVGGLISRRFLQGPERAALENLVTQDLGLPALELERSVATPGAGAGLLPAPQQEG
jgi:galactokinase